MSKTRFTPWVVLACIGTLAGCTSGEDGTVGNTELNIVLPNGCEQDSSAPECFDIGTVEYTIACDDGDPTPNGPFLDNNAGFDDRIRISGVLEVFAEPQPGRPGRATSGDPWTWGKDLGDIYVAQGFMDLPVTQRCTAQLRARTEPTTANPDGEVICTDTVSFDVAADMVSTVNVLMYCGLSFQAPVAQLDLAADFSFNVSNFCPDLFVLNCAESNPVAPLPGIPPTTYCETRFRDGDSSCGGSGIQPGDPDGASSCDPQVCDETAPEGVRCAPLPSAVDPLVMTTVTCDSNGLIDCEGDFVFDGSCSWSGDTPGIVGAGVPVPVLLGGPGPDPGGFFVSCNPGALPGSTVTCTAVTTDGDTDCDKTKVVTFDCPGLLPCEDFDILNGGSGTQAGADALCDVDPLDCLVGSCDNTTCDGATAGACCTEVNAAPGTSCQVDVGGTIFAGLCDNAGTCISSDCNAQPPAFCDDGNQCTSNACEADGSCSTTNLTIACDTGTGSGDGTCGGGVCNNNDECTPGDVSGCPAAAECFENSCNISGAPYLCDATNFAPAGTICTGGGQCDGAGNCDQPFILNDNAAQTTNWRALPKLCTEGIFDTTAFTYECCTGAGTPAGCVGDGTTSTDVENGGIASGTSDPTSVVDGCSVPSSLLGGQLAVDTFLDVTVSSSGGLLTTSATIVAVNSGLQLAGAIALVVSLSMETDITSGTPGTVTNVLNPLCENTPVNAYVAGLPANLTLIPFTNTTPDAGNCGTGAEPCGPCSRAGVNGGQIDDTVLPVIPTTAPNMDVNFSGRFLLELFLTTAGAPLPVDGQSCVFDLPGPDLVLSTTDPN